MAKPKPDEYQCQICNVIFNTYDKYYKHKIKKKNCMSKEMSLKINTQKQYYKSALEKEKRRVIKLEKQIDFLQTQKHIINDLTEKVDASLKDTEQHRLEHNLVVNNHYINKLNYNDNNVQFNMALSLQGQETLDHISDKQMLSILDNKKFGDTIKALVRAVYFNPKAIENCKWCITDDRAIIGTLEYNPESNTVSRKVTEKVIKRNVLSILHRVNTINDTLKSKYQFNQTQLNNYNNFYDMLSLEFEKEWLDSSKKIAYNSRNFIKGLWGQLGVTIEVERIKPQIRMKSTK